MLMSEENASDNQNEEEHYEGNDYWGCDHGDCGGSYWSDGIRMEGIAVL